MTRARRSLAAVGLVAAGLLAAPAARAQPRPGIVGQHQMPVLGGGTELFRALLDHEGVQPIPPNQMGPGHDVIVVVVGTTASWNFDPMLLARQVLQQGGAALVATDTATAFYEFNKNFGDGPVTRISGTPITADARDCYQPDPTAPNLDDTPFVVPESPDDHVKNGLKPGRVWDVFRGLTKLATNDPSYFDRVPRFRGEFQYPLARLPKSSKIGVRPLASPLFAVGGDGPALWGGHGGYSFLAVADASVYINQMLSEPGTDNFEFALRTIEYLQGAGKDRKRCLFFENGRAVERFDELKAALAKQKPKAPPGGVPNIGPKLGQNQEELARLIDKRAEQLEDRDELHRSRIGPPGSERERRRFGDLIEVAAVVAAVGAALFLLRRTLSARQPQDLPPPPSTGAGAAPTGPPGVFERRQRELVRRNNLYEPVRNLIREFFDTTGAPAPGPRMPGLVIDRRAVRKPDSLRQAVRDMWRLAYGPPAHISAQRWFELEPYFTRLRRAHEDGKWRFAADGA
jgi:hypothetical protein